MILFLSGVSGRLFFIDFHFFLRMMHAEGPRRAWALGVASSGFNVSTTLKFLKSIEKRGTG
jgi:hypothetical protein